MAFFCSISRLPRNLVGFEKHSELRDIVYYYVAKFSLDEPFHNFRESKSVDQRIVCSPVTSCDGFESSKIVIGHVCILAFTSSDVQALMAAFLERDRWIAL